MFISSNSMILLIGSVINQSLPHVFMLPKPPKCYGYGPRPAVSRPMLTRPPEQCAPQTAPQTPPAPGGRGEGTREGWGQGSRGSGRRQPPKDHAQWLFFPNSVSLEGSTSGKNYLSKAP